MFVQVEGWFPVSGENTFVTPVIDVRSSGLVEVGDIEWAVGGQLRPLFVSGHPAWWCEQWSWVSDRLQVVSQGTKGSYVHGFRLGRQVN